MAEKFHTARAFFRGVSPLALPRLVGKLAGAYAMAAEAERHMKNPKPLSETLTAMAAGATITAAATDLPATGRILESLERTTERAAQAAVPVLVTEKIVQEVQASLRRTHPEE